MHYSFLWIDLLILALAAGIALLRKSVIQKKWRWIYPAVLIPVFLFLIWDSIFTRLGVWNLNKAHILGSFLVNVAWEDVLFLLCTAFLCLMIYEWLRTTARGPGSKAVAVAGGWFLVLLCAVAVVFYYDRIYTAVTALLLLVTLVNHLTATRGNYLSHIFIAWCIALVPLAFLNGLLTATPIKLYDAENIIGYRIAGIPIENFFYDLLLMIWVIWIFEYFRQKPIFKAAREAK
jgi:lycopene cyclase domain-containing protein